MNKIALLGLSVISIASYAKDRGDQHNPYTRPRLKLCELRKMAQENYEFAYQEEIEEHPRYYCGLAKKDVDCKEQLIEQGKQPKRSDISWTQTLLLVGGAAVVAAIFLFHTPESAGAYGMTSPDPWSGTTKVIAGLFCAGGGSKATHDVLKHGVTCMNEINFELEYEGSKAVYKGLDDYLKEKKEKAQSK